MAASSASEDDVNTGGQFCVMHVISNTKSKFLNFSKRSWEKFISCAAKWKDIDELTGVEWVHCLYLFLLVLGKM